jgi:hypothetical protein
MLASRQWNINRSRDDDWFDAILNTDTKLFIDPFRHPHVHCVVPAGGFSRIISAGFIRSMPASSSL